MQPNIQAHCFVGHGIDHPAAEHHAHKDQGTDRGQPRLDFLAKLFEIGMFYQQMSVHVAPTVSRFFAEAAGQPCGANTGIGFGFGGERVDETVLRCRHATTLVVASITSWKSRLGLSGISRTSNSISRKALSMA